MPPGATSPSIMFSSVIAPPRLVYESWKQSTAPVEVSVVRGGEDGRVGHAEPGLGALGRRADRGRHGAVVGALEAERQADADAAPGSPSPRRSRSPAACRPTIRPKVRGSENGMHSSRKISSQFVQAVGFSNGCAELAL